MAIAIFGSIGKNRGCSIVYAEHTTQNALVINCGRNRKKDVFAYLQENRVKNVYIMVSDFTKVCFGDVSALIRLCRKAEISVYVVIKQREAVFFDTLSRRLRSQSFYFRFIEEQNIWQYFDEIQFVTYFDCRVLAKNPTGIVIRWAQKTDYITTAPFSQHGLEKLERFLIEYTPGRICLLDRDYGTDAVKRMAKEKGVRIYYFWKEFVISQ